MNQPSSRADDRAQAVVAFGGGHGLFASLSALRRLVDDLTIDELTAVVTVADNGGSSGRLREEFDVIPPGDLRMALSALCGEDDWGRTWAKVVQHRFSGDGGVGGHAIGNLLIVGLWEILGDPVAGLDHVGKLLGASGRVLPMAAEPMDITALVHGADPTEPDAVVEVRGQVEIATSPGTITEVHLDPPDPAVPAQVADAIADADWLVFGPGSWFTSVMPHLLVPDIRDAILASEARVVIVLNLATQVGETDGFSPADYLHTLTTHAPDLNVHTILADGARVGESVAELESIAARFGARLALAELGVDDGSAVHDPKRLSAALSTVFEA